MATMPEMKVETIPINQDVIKLFNRILDQNDLMLDFIMKSMSIPVALVDMPDADEVEKAIKEGLGLW